ncbi:MAG: hypothetical protein M3081_04480 [Gemmatimonadota bacterium]|nr:hypothetical protein [Gemmatimonadota bacterium]
MTVRRFTPALVVAMVACARGGTIETPVTAPAATYSSDYPSIVAAAYRSALAGRFGDADTALSNYVKRHPASPESRDASYWRALFNLDPANKTGSTQRATEQLDRYLADSALANHRAEALILRRLAADIETMQAALERARATPTTPTRDPDLGRENLRLRDELEKTSAELERVRKRLAGKP